MDLKEGGLKHGKVQFALRRVFLHSHSLLKVKLSTLLEMQKVTISDDFSTLVERNIELSNQQNMGFERIIKFPTTSSSPPKSEGKKARDFGLRRFREHSLLFKNLYYLVLHAP